MISKAINCFGTALQEDLIEDLTSNQYSLSIDTTTKGGKNICAIEARHLKEHVTAENNKELYIENRVVGIKYMGKSATGQEIF